MERQTRHMASGRRSKGRAVLYALLSGVLLSLATPLLFAASPTKNAAKAAAGAEAKDKKSKDAAPAEDEFPPPSDGNAVRKKFSHAEVERVCQKYEGTMIAYYGEVFRVEHCRRRPIMDNKTVYLLQRDGHKVLDVDGDTVAAIPEGDAVDEATTIERARSCKVLEGQYVTFSNVDVYFVEHCKKRLFPDWATYIKHRERLGDTRGEILALSWIEFDRLEAGKPISSIVDDMFAKLLTGDAGVEIIPVNEACEGVEGKFVAYYSRVYRVEHCRKREITFPDLYLKRLGPAGVKVVELKSDQWLSLPDGVPITDKTSKPATTAP